MNNSHAVTSCAVRVLTDHGLDVLEACGNSLQRLARIGNNIPSHRRRFFHEALKNDPRVAERTCIKSIQSLEQTSHRHCRGNFRDPARFCSYFHATYPKMACLLPMHPALNSICVFARLRRPIETWFARSSESKVVLTTLAKSQPLGHLSLLPRSPPVPPIQLRQHE